ncbi:MAG TPA: hypothetical protein VFK94_06690, partial [Patescibacteria group bacterium]|nr:hypothetical protein [Patescibacteria group bacterium]
MLDAGTGNIRLSDLATCTALETVNGLLTCGTDDTGVAGSSNWTLTSAAGTLSPNNNTLDVLIGGVTTESAKFALLNVAGSRGTQTATLSGNLVLDAVSSIQTTNDQTLTIGGNTTGNIVITPNQYLTLGGTVQGFTLGGNIAGSGTPNISGLGTVSGNVFQGTTSVTFGQASQTTAITGSSVSISNLATNGFVKTSGGTGLLSVSSTIDLGSEVSGFLPFTNGGSQWTQDNSLGTLTPRNNTLDILVGGASSQSAKFAILNVAGARGSQTATLSGSLTLDAAGGLQTTQGQTLTIGGGTSGNLILGQSGKSVTFAALNTCTALETVNGILTCGTDDGITSYDNFWQYSSSAGIVANGNLTTDFLLGGTATSSAKFAVINVAGGTPTASISAGTTDNAAFLTGTGNLATTNRQTLTLGGTATGDIVLDAGTGNIRLSDLATCTALETVNGLLTCGTDDTGVAGSSNWT